MTTINQKYYYAVVKKGTERFVRMNGYLPIFLTLATAKKHTLGLIEIEIKKIKSDKIIEALKEN